ncbi:hypothetical protein GCM10007049_01780 [Echinicola pacifica]|uniref:Endo-acting ulvan lyase C-terminal domain-containing protein n=1 Tax=Echinicola pacifica TaxID=346377 RepID=A0A918PJV3_9BACT|nr:hypothetical protein [Echinicola pacifica]GGZ13616.1 hypothetical protein GCM10007049_01780 [Echinicola pacifica]
MIINIDRLIRVVFALSCLSLGIGDSMAQSVSSGQETASHPVLFGAQYDRSALEQKIRNNGWAEESWEALLAEVDPYVSRHQTDPDWIVSRLAMYWKEGEHYTQCYIKDQDWDYGEGNAPVPTVRLPGMRRWNDFRNVPLEERTPYNETGDMWGISRSSGDSTPILVPYKESGHMIRNNNKEILELAEKASFVYYMTQDENYAKFSADILWTWLIGTYYMQPPLDPERSSKGPGGYEPGGILGYYDYEVIHDDRQYPAATAYDFLHDYMMDNPADHLAQLDMNVTDLAGQVFKRFIEIGLVRGGSKGNWNVNRYRHILSSMLVLETNDYYEDGKGREYYIPYYTEISREYHDALPEIIKNYDKHTGLWPESPGYASAMIGVVLEMAMPLYANGVNTIGDNPLLQKAAMANLGWLDPRGNLVVFGDMRGGPLDYAVFERLLTYYTWEGDTINAQKIAAVLNKGFQAGQYQRSNGGWRGIVLNEPLSTKDSTLPYHRAAYSPFHRHMIMKNGNDDQDGMMFTLYGGREGSHLSSNGLAWQFYGNGWALAPDGAAYESYWSADMNYYTGVVGSNTIVQGYKKGEITINAMDPFVPADGFYNEVTTSENFSFADISADEKRRMIAMVRTSPSSGYYIDIFRSDLEENDYLHHSLGNEHLLTTTNGTALPLMEDSIPNAPHPAYSYFSEVKSVRHSEDFRSSWILSTSSPKIHVDMWMMGQEGRTIFQMDAPPTTLRPDVSPEQINKSPEKTPALLIRQTDNNAATSPFVAVFESYEEGEKSIEEITRLQASEHFVSLKVSSKDNEQYIFNATDEQEYKGEHDSAFEGIFGIASLKNGRLEYLYLGKGKKIRFDGYQIESLEGPMSAELRYKEGKYSYSSDQPIKISLPKQGEKEYPAGYNIQITID